MKVLPQVKNNFSALVEIVRILIRHRQLMLHMARREIGERYTGSVLGAFWAVGHPLIQMSVYLFVFTIIFKVKIGGQYDQSLDYPVYLLSGLIPWMSIQESMVKGSTAIVANSNLVKQVVFPIEVLPFKTVLTSMVTLMISLPILLLYFLIRYHHLYLTHLLLPVLIFFQILLMAGISYMISAIGVYFRDLKDLVQVFATIGVYIIPAFYLPAWIPKLFISVLYLNPFSYLIWCYQDLIYYGRFEHPWAWPMFMLISIASFSAGYRIFRKLKTGFGNVL